VSRTQRELKALRQQQREEAAARQRARDRRNLYIIAGVIGAAAVAILVVALALNQASKNASRLTFQTYSGPTLGTAGTDEGTPSHIDPSTQWTYKSYPPTNGPHYSVAGRAPVNWGTVDTLVEGQFVHNLEHGGIVILYNCPSGSDCTSLKNSLTNYVQNLAPLEPTFNEAKIIMTPYSHGMQKKVALVAWKYIEFLDAYDQNAITQFYENHVDRGPEAIP
jgi:hypothetical protein